MESLAERSAILWEMVRGGKGVGDVTSGVEQGKQHMKKEVQVLKSLLI